MCRSLSSQDISVLNRICRDYFVDVFLKSSNEVKSEMIKTFAGRSSVVFYEGDNHSKNFSLENGFTELVRSEIPRLSVKVAHSYMYKYLFRRMYNEFDGLNIDKICEEFSNLDVITKKAVLGKFKIHGISESYDVYGGFINSLEIDVDDNIVEDIKIVLNSLNEFECLQLMVSCNKEANLEIDELVCNIKKGIQKKNSKFNELLEGFAFLNSSLMEV